MEPISQSSINYSKPAAAPASQAKPKPLIADLQSKLSPNLGKPAAAKGLGLRKAEVLAAPDRTEVKSGETNAKYNNVIGELHDKLGLARKRLQHQLDVLTSKEVQHPGAPLIESPNVIAIRVALGKLDLISSESTTEINNIDADRALAEAIALAERLEFEEAEAKRKAEAMDRGFAEHLALKEQLESEEAATKAKLKDQADADRVIAERLHDETAASARPAAAHPVLPVIVLEKEDDGFESINLPKKEEEDDGVKIERGQGAVEYGLIDSIYSWFTVGRHLNKEKPQEKK